MPLYEYFCEDCEVYFTELKPIAAYDDPAYCPACAQQADKIISAPHLNTMRAERRFAYETNERSAHEPKVRHTCGANCHHHAHKPKQEPAAPAYKQQLNRRPWMLGH
jgi:putative FmdB family regulatory protein